MSQKKTTLTENMHLLKRDVTLRRKQDSPFLMNHYHSGSNIRRHLHKHKECEICYFPHDSGTFLFEKSEVTINPGDVFLNGPNTYHHPIFDQEQNQGLIALYFHPDLLAHSPPDWAPLLSSLFRGEPGYRRLQGSTQSVELIIKALNVFNEKARNWEILCQGILLNLIAHFAHDYLTHRQSRLEDQYRSSYRLANAVEYITTHFREEIPGERLYEIAGMSRSQFCQRFKDVYGTSSREFIFKLRLKHAKHLLKTTHASVCEIALTSGFPWVSRFNHAFKRDTGITPSEYRRRIRR